jgi:hypothetical protein
MLDSSNNQHCIIPVHYHESHLLDPGGKLVYDAQSIRERTMLGTDRVCVVRYSLFFIKNGNDDAVECILLIGDFEELMEIFLGWRKKMGGSLA